MLFYRLATKTSSTCKLEIGNFQREYCLPDQFYSNFRRSITHCKNTLYSFEAISLITCASPSDWQVVSEPVILHCFVGTRNDKNHMLTDIFAMEWNHLQSSFCPNLGKVWAADSWWFTAFLTCSLDHQWLSHVLKLQGKLEEEQKICKRRSRRSKIWPRPRLFPGSQNDGETRRSIRAG